jgi:hypothetical protein
MTKPNRNEWTNNKIRSVVVYASVAEFRDAFLSNMNHLYLLAYLLTGDHEMAVRCFVLGFEQCIDGSSVFKGWVQSWARRAVIKNAILMTSSESEGDGERCNKDYHQVICRREKDNLLQNVVQLKPFERCVFVMSILEQFSDYECSLLLSCTRGEVARGRRSAIEHLTSVFV